GEASTEGCATQGRVVEDLAAEGDQRLDLDATEPFGERARGEATGQCHLRPRTQWERVARGHEMDRRTHHRGPDGTVILERGSQLVRVEVGEAGPEPDVRREGSLRLHADEVFDLVDGCRRRAFQ